MRWQAVGFGATGAAVLVLLGSLVLGLRGGPEAEADDMMVGPASPLLRERIRVEVLNSAGITGLAREVTERLRAEGFDVVYYGNAGRLARDSTVILDRSGDAGAVRQLGIALGIDRFETALDTTLYVEATVILGPDWAERR